MSKPKAYSYLRFSTLEQGKGDSTRRQTEAAERYAAEHGLEMDYSLNLQDPGVSAYRGKNFTKGALSVFLEAVEEGLVPQGSYLLVESLDRVSRQTPYKAIGAITSLVEAGIVVVTLMDRKVYDKTSLGNSMDFMWAVMSMVRAHDESKTKGLRVGAAWKNKRDRLLSGERKVLTRMCPSWLIADKAADCYRVDEAKATTVRRIFAMYAGGMGTTGIAKALNDEAVPTLGDADYWRHSAVKKILQHPAVIGRIQLGRVTDEGREALQLVDGHYPPIVDEDSYLAAQRRFKVPPARGAYTGVFHFSGLLRCHLCGSSVQRVNKGSVYYRCSKSAVRACSGPLISEVKWRDRIAYALRDVVLSMPLTSDDRLSAERTSALIDLDMTTDEAQELVKEIAAGNASPSLREALREKDQRILEIQDRMREIEGQLQSSRSGYIESRQFDLIGYLQALDEVEPTQVKTALQDVFSSVTVVTEGKEVVSLRVKAHHLDAEIEEHLARFSAVND